MWTLPNVSAYFYNDKVNQLIVYFANSSLAVVDANSGKILTTVPNYALDYPFFMVNPVDGNLILSSYYDDWVVSLNLVTFKTAWKFTVPFKNPLIVGIMTDDGILIIRDIYFIMLFAINCTDGSILWNMTQIHASPSALLTTTNGTTVLVVTVVEGDGTKTPLTHLMALDPATGTVLATSPKFDGYLDSPVTVRNTIIFAHRTLPDHMGTPHGIYQVEYEKMSQIESFSLISNVSAWITYIRILRDGTIYGLVTDYWNNPQGPTAVLCIFRPSEPGKLCPFPNPPRSSGETLFEGKWALSNKPIGKI